MSDWETQLKAAEAGAELSEAAEQVAEGKFKAVQAHGNDAEALDSAEFRTWMASRHETDEAWGKWATVMDAKPAG